MFKYRNVISIPPLGMIDDLAAIARCGPESVVLNAVINAKMNLKKLEFNQTKCVKLHVCKENKKKCSIAATRNVGCVFLEVQDAEMQSAESEKYIGDVISSNGSNDANISRRVSIGYGAISQIMAVLHEISYGYQFVEIGLVMRESILLSKILLSSESWHKLFLYQIEKLNDVDKSFFKNLFNSHSKTALEFYYSETGSIPLHIKISMRRLNYWWHILSVENSEMISKIYNAQKLSPVSGDWTQLLEKDKKQFDIAEMTDSEVRAISQIKFKNFIKKKAQELTVRYLVELKKKHSKSDKLDVKDLVISEYLIDKRFSKEERELLFRLRSETVDVKETLKMHISTTICCVSCVECFSAHKCIFSSAPNLPFLLWWTKM